MSESATVHARVIPGEARRRRDRSAVLAAVSVAVPESA